MAYWPDCYCPPDGAHITLNPFPAEKMPPLGLPNGGFKGRL